MKITCSASPPPLRYKLGRSKVSQMEKYTFLYATVYITVLLISFVSSGQGIFAGKLKRRVHSTERHQKRQRSVHLFTRMGLVSPKSARSQCHRGTDCEL